MKVIRSKVPMSTTVKFEDLSPGDAFMYPNQELEDANIYLKVEPNSFNVKVVPNSNPKHEMVKHRANTILVAGGEPKVLSTSENVQVIPVVSILTVAPMVHGFNE